MAHLELVLSCTISSHLHFVLGISGMHGGNENCLLLLLLFHLFPVHLCRLLHFLLFIRLLLPLLRVRHVLSPAISYTNPRHRQFIIHDNMSPLPWTTPRGIRSWADISDCSCRWHSTLVVTDELARHFWRHSFCRHRPASPDIQGHKSFTSVHIPMMHALPTRLRNGHCRFEKSF